MHPLCVIAVDDSRDTADSFVRLLSLWGHEPFVAYDADTALALARSKKPDVVLLDLAMPGVDGLQLARRLRAEPDLDSTVLIAVSGHGMAEHQQGSAAAGCEHHLLKPIDPLALQWLLNEYSIRLQNGLPLRE
jgi:CheY-like chemotaxis protein